MNKRRNILLISEYFCDIFSLLLSNAIAYFLLNIIWQKVFVYFSSHWKEYLIVEILAFTIVFLYFSSHIDFPKRDRSREFKAVLRNCLLTFTFFAFLLLLLKAEIFESRYLFFGSVLIFILTSSASRYTLKHLLIARFSQSKMATIVGVLTTCDLADEYVKKLKEDWSHRIVIVGLADAVEENGVYRYRPSAGNTTATEHTVAVLDKAETVNEIHGVPVIADWENYIGWIRTAALDEIYINLPKDYSTSIRSFIEELQDMGITIHINIPFLEEIVTADSKFGNINCKVYAGSPVVTFAPTVHNDIALVIKRCFDIVGGALGSLISLPIILLTAIPLKLETPGPLIFKQQRIGANGRIFTIYKLRSMYIDAETRKKNLMMQNQVDGNMFKIDNDPRITKVGKFIRRTSIDELPQFWNVLKGDMSLVGTRPPTIDEFEQYQSHHKRRLSMRPGITGNWQVSGRSDIRNFEDVVRLDCEYIDNWSLWFDFKILLKTVKAVLKGTGAE